MTRFLFSMAFGSARKPAAVPRAKSITFAAALFSLSISASAGDKASAASLANGDRGAISPAPRLARTGSDQPAMGLSAMVNPSTSSNSAPFVSLTPANGAVANSPTVLLQGRVTNDIYTSPQISFAVSNTSISLDGLGNFAGQLNLTPGVNNFTFTASTPNPRQQPNLISAYLDGSVIYGSDATRAAALRAFQGGQLKTSGDNLPPLNTAGLPNANDAHLFPDNQLFLAGDVRANENVELSAIHTLFLREHNQIASAIAAKNPTMSDEDVFQLARRIVVAELQVITYNEFLPALLGYNPLPSYTGYKPDVNPGISTEFSTAAYRIGHTLINDDVEFLDNDGNPVRAEMDLDEAFFNPQPLKDVGPAPLLKYLATDDAQEVDTQLVPSLRNFLFGPPGAGGFDLASLNIQRGRDHGLSDYNTVRAAYGLARVTSFAQITSDSVLQQKLTNLYGSIDAIDLWVGGLAEDHAPGSSVGPTFRAIIVDQFTRVRDGDRNWYALTFSGKQLAAVQQTRLSDIIRRNTTITKIQDNVFYYDPGSLATVPDRAGTLPETLINLPGDVSSISPASLDGSGNNLTHTAWGVAGVDLMRFSAAAYNDTLSTPAGLGRPSARLVSNLVCELTATSSNARSMSDWIYGWGQFVDHDLDLTTTGDTTFDVLVPPGDPYFDPNNTGTAVISFTRSIFDATSGTATPNTQQLSYTIVYHPNATITFTQWQDAQFTPDEVMNHPEISSATADPDGDGLDNLLEYAFNADPTDPTSNNRPALSLDATSLSLTYTKDLANSDLTYVIEQSTDLTNWTAVTTTDQILSDDGFVQTVKAQVPRTNADGGKLFLHLRVTKA